MSAGVRASEVDVYQQQRGGRWVARIDAREVHGDAVTDTREGAELIAEGFRDGPAAIRATATGEAGLGDGPLVLPREEFDAAKHVLGVLNGEGKA